MTAPDLRVLIVDDQPAVVKALEVLFDLNGIPHVAASSPAEALAAARGETLGVVIQDMNFARNETRARPGSSCFTPSPRRSRECRSC